jgi:hypothetical protein
VKRKPFYSVEGARRSRAPSIAFPLALLANLMDLLSIKSFKNHEINSVLRGHGC